ncbi:MAG TPA: TetR/AcrR family transcriptional regulator [Actinocrinis sp.]|nr:TetR/AcrR family transcriptional regulator [Actinocrinis sp.]
MARGGATASADHERQREQLVDAALRVVGEGGLGELTVRRIAEAAGTSTMTVYSRFGGRDGMLEAVYRQAFVMLGDAFRAASAPAAAGGGGEAGSGSLSRLLGLALAYRAFALASPPRYTFMFGRPPVDFEPAEQVRAEVLQGAFGPLIGAVRDASGHQGVQAVRVAYFVWAAMHGLVGLEFADVLRHPLPGWDVAAPSDDGAGERMYAAGVRAMLNGLGLVPAKSETGS